MEMKTGRKLGLSYYCDNKFTPVTSVNPKSYLLTGEVKESDCIEELTKRGE